MNLTQKTKQHYEKQGAIIGLVERYNSFTHRRNDLFGWIDQVMVWGGVVYGVQTCSMSGLAEHRTKILAEPKFKKWVEAGAGAIIMAWEKHGLKGKRKTWRAREYCYDTLKAEFREVPNEQDKEFEGNTTEAPTYFP